MKESIKIKKLINFFFALVNLFNRFRQGRQTFKEGELMKIKRALINLLSLVSDGGTTTVCTREKFLKNRVPGFAKLGFLTHFLM